MDVYLQYKMGKKKFAKNAKLPIHFNYCLKTSSYCKIAKLPKLPQKDNLEVKQK